MNAMERGAFTPRLPNVLKDQDKCMDACRIALFLGANELNKEYYLSTARPLAAHLKQPPSMLDSS